MHLPLCRGLVGGYRFNPKQHSALCADVAGFFLVRGAPLRSGRCRQPVHEHYQQPGQDGVTPVGYCKNVREIVSKDLQLDRWDEPESEEQEDADQDIAEPQSGNAKHVDGECEHQVEQEADACKCRSVEHGVWPEAASKVDGRAEERWENVAEQQRR